MSTLGENKHNKSKKLLPKQILLLVGAALTGFVGANIMYKLTNIENKSNISSIGEDKTAQKLVTLNTAITKLADEKIFTVPPQFKKKIIYQIQPKNNTKVVALTFDDGPWPKSTLQVLDILKKHKIKATFFAVGSNLQKYPDMARKIVAEGHTIGNHTWHHRYNKVDQATAAKEIDNTAVLINKITGIKTLYFRPPGGALHNGLAAYAQKQSYAIMMWSVDSGDSRGHNLNSKQLALNVIKQTKPGGIVLMHDGGGNRSSTVQALPGIINTLKKQKYNFVTLPELLDLQDNSIKQK